MVIREEQVVITITLAKGPEHFAPGLWLVRRFQHTGFNPRGGQFYLCRFEMCQAFVDYPMQTAAQAAEDRSLDGLACRGSMVVATLPLTAPATLCRLIDSAFSIVNVEEY